MNDARTPPPGISAADWAATPQGVRMLVVALHAQVVALQDQVVAQQTQIVRLKGVTGLGLDCWIHELSMITEVSHSFTLFQPG